MSLNIPSSKQQVDNCPQENRHLMALMREQIEICLAFYKENTNSMLKQQAKYIVLHCREIDNLRVKLVQNEKEIHLKN